VDVFPHYKEEFIKDAKQSLNEQDTIIEDNGNRFLDIQRKSYYVYCIHQVWVRLSHQTEDEDEIYDRNYEKWRWQSRYLQAIKDVRDTDAKSHTQEYFRMLPH
jgi:hypothetical protein